MTTTESGRLWLVRHGHTTENGDRFLGRSDVPLDDAGLEQAHAAGRILSTEMIDALWTSPLECARTTAGAIVVEQTHPVPAPVDRAELLELDCGAWEGPLNGVEEIGKRDPDERLPGGESVRDVWRRVLPFADEVCREVAEGRTVVVVGHCLIGRLLRAAVQGRPLDEALDPTLRAAPGSVHRVAV
jgi:probable phosphoglycerate mutase